MSDDQRNPVARRSSDSGDASVLSMVMRAYDRAQAAYGQSQTVSDFKLDLSKSRCEELDSEKAATRDRLFSEG